MEMHSDILAMGIGVDEEEEEGFWGSLFSSDGADDEEEVEEEPVSMSADDGMEMMDEEEPWYMRNWQAVGAVGLILALILMAWLVLRRYYSDVTEDLEEFEDEYLDDDDEEDDDEEEEGRGGGVLRTMATILCRSITALAVLFALGAATPVSARMNDATINPDELFYVIKVTPTLVYLDTGIKTGAMVGETFVLLGESDGADPYQQVAEIRVIRVHDEFSIAEVLFVEHGEGIEVLQRAISMDGWLASGSLAMAEDKMPGALGKMGRWSLHVIGGPDLNKGVEVISQSGTPSGTNGILDAGIGLRLSRTSGKLRLNLTGRVAGLMGDAEITQMSAELDAHVLFRGADKAGFYVGAGVGEQRLKGDFTGSCESAFKGGFNGIVGLNLPISGGWSWQIESGYQFVTSWHNTIEIDPSHIRAHLGVARPL